MNAAARRLLILRKLEENNAVDINDIVKACGVSIATVRRDFKFMEDQGLITTTHGGAVLTLFLSVEPVYIIKKDLMIDEKRRIGETVSKMLEPYSNVCIDCGTTAKEVAEYISDRKELTVFSNSLLVASVLTQKNNLKFFMLPGQFRSNSMGYVGASVVDYVSNLRFDCIVLGCEGIDTVSGATVPDIEDGCCKRALVRSSNKVILAVDHSKFEQTATVSIAQLKEIDVIVTGKELDEKYLTTFAEFGIKIVLA